MNTLSALFHPFYLQSRLYTQKESRKKGGKRRRNQLSVSSPLRTHRLDSAYGTSLYTEADKMAWLQRLCDMGVTNIEMEAPEFAAFCKRMDIPALLICVTLLNRMDGDQVCADDCLLFPFPLLR